MCCWFCFATKRICSMMRCAKRRFQPSPTTARPSLENHRGGLDGLGVFLHFDSDIETKIPQNKNFGTGTPTNTKLRWDICRCSCWFSGYRFSSFVTKHLRRNRFLLAQFRFGCICSLCCKLLLSNFATKPFHVTRNAKRPRHNHQIETAIHS